MTHKNSSMRWGRGPGAHTTKPTSENASFNKTLKCLMTLWSAQKTRRARVVGGHANWPGSLSEICHIGTDTRETSMAHSCGYGLSILVGIAGVLVGCGGAPGQHSSAAGTGKDGGTSAVPPKPISDRPPCILSADCPAGLHCDLGECIQDCNTASACSGDKNLFVPSALPNPE